MKEFFRFRSTFLAGLSLLAIATGAAASPADPAPPVERPRGALLLGLGAAGLAAALFGGKTRRSDRF